MSVDPIQSAFNAAVDAALRELLATEWARRAIDTFVDAAVRQEVSRLIRSPVELAKRILAMDTAETLHPEQSAGTGTIDGGPGL